MLPALARANYKGMRTYCINNIHQQYLSQIMYADDNSGKFCFHDDSSRITTGPRTPRGGASSI